MYNDHTYKTIIRSVVGSTLHGINNEDGTEDRDEMGVCIEPIEAQMGLSSFEQHIYRSAVVRSGGDHNARSMKGDLDLTIYSLRKFMKLALKGNPSILALFFAPVPMVLTEEGKELQALAPCVVSKRAGRAFLGYMEAQRGRLAGERGSAHGKPRPELVEKYGYDTKYACHIIRLALQGIELLSRGTLQLPMFHEHRDLCMDVRNGCFELKEVLDRANYLKGMLEGLLKETCLPEHPNERRVEQWLVEKYSNHWGCK